MWMLLSACAQHRPVSNCVSALAAQVRVGGGGQLACRAKRVPKTVRKKAARRIERARVAAYLVAGARSPKTSPQKVRYMQQGLRAWAQVTPLAPRGLCLPQVTPAATALTFAVACATAVARRSSVSDPPPPRGTAAVAVGGGGAGGAPRVRHSARSRDAPRLLWASSDTPPSAPPAGLRRIQGVRAVAAGPRAVSGTQRGRRGSPSA